MEYIKWIVPAIMLAAAVWQSWMISKGTAVVGTLIGYDEDTSYNPSLDQVTDSITPIYEYEYDGKVRNFRSYACMFPLLRKDTHKFYIGPDERPYELEGVWLCLFLAVLIFLIG